MQTKIYSYPSRICIFLSLSYSYGIETVNIFIHSLVPLKTIANSRLKWAKCIPVCRRERRKNPTWWGVTYIHGLYKGVPPGFFFKKKVWKTCCRGHFHFCEVWLKYEVSLACEWEVHCTCSTGRLAFGSVTSPLLKRCLVYTALS